MGEPPLVRDVAMTFRSDIYKDRKTNLTSVIVAGWDKVNGGQVYSINAAGVLVAEPCSVAGSGSIFIQGFVTSNYQPGLGVEETVELAKKAVRLAINHDCFSGGVVRIGIINKDGIETRVSCQHEPEICQIANQMLWNLEIDQW